MSRARYGGDHKILLPLYRGDRKIPYPFDKGDLKFNETNFARFFRPPPPIVNELPLNTMSKNPYESDLWLQKIFEGKEVYRISEFTCRYRDAGSQDLMHVSVHVSKVDD